MKNRYELTREDTGKKELLRQCNHIKGIQTHFTEEEVKKICEDVSEVLNTKITYKEVRYGEK
jgi:hypothetical protein